MRHTDRPEVVPVFVAERPAQDPTPQPPTGTAEPKRPLVVIGSGTDAADAFAVVRAADPTGARWRFVGFLDDAGGAAAPPPDAPVGHLGGIRTLVELDPDTRFVLAAGTPAVRRIVASWARARGREAAGVAHPSASFDPGSVGAGHTVGARVRIDPAAVVGEFAAVAADVVIGAATVGAFVTVGSGSCVADGAVVEDEVVLGRDVVVAAGVRVGARAVVHDGVEVLTDVPADARMAPAEVQRA